MALRVLVVEDDAAGLAMLQLSLRKAGFAVSAAGDGAAALLLLSESPYDCLLTDSRMEPMDGCELSKRAKALQPSLRILMISALDHCGRCSGCPINGFYQKPVSVDALVKALAGPLRPDNRRVENNR